MLKFEHLLDHLGKGSWCVHVDSVVVQDMINTKWFGKTRKVLWYLIYNYSSRIPLESRPRRITWHVSIYSTSFLDYRTASRQFGYPDKLVFFSFCSISMHFVVHSERKWIQANISVQVSQIRLYKEHLANREMSCMFEKANIIREITNCIVFFRNAKTIQAWPLTMCIQLTCLPRSGATLHSCNGLHRWMRVCVRVEVRGSWLRG